MNLKFFSILACLILLACSQEEPSLSGYIEGEYTYISSGLSGTLFKLYVSRGQAVKKDELLYQLDPQPEAAAVEAIKQTIDAQKDQLEFAKIELKRQKELYKNKYTSKERVDQANLEYEIKLGQLMTTQAQLIQSEWSLQQKKIYSPINGRVFDVFYRIGEKVQDNHPVLAILAPENIQILFYVNEPQLSNLKIGQKISFTCDGCSAKLAATINFISPEAEYTPPIIYSKDTRNKLVFLVRATLPKDQRSRFHPGQPISVYLHE